MCYGATCPTCSRRSWRGCGSHIPAALSSYPEDDWCICEPRVVVDGVPYPPAAKLEVPGISWLSNMLGFGGGGSQKNAKGKEDL
ncbi:hypothetical protein BX600DRAFT_456766 [Xylariales sp. PMI_506]|nr:hypothetical protein BX600DRAFT_456766 [Xylariales sp. PMI_506]